MKKLLLISIACLSSWAASSQRNVQESVYLQLNDQFFITGETLLFSAFCNSESTGQPSNLSKILYVELIGAQDRVVFQQKIALENGRGAGEFFISSLISTGSYQLLAYTRWMKNFGQYYQSKIEIINPFEPYEVSESKKGKELKFMPDGGNLIPGVSNKIAIKASGYGKVKGKVTDSEGESLAEFTTDSQGYGLFEIIPNPSQTYKAILEDSVGNFHFEDLPQVAADGVSIQLNELPGTYEFKIIGQIPSSVQLVVTDGQNFILNEPVAAGTNYSLAKRNLKPGVYKATIWDMKSELSSRLFLHPKSENLANQPVQLNQELFDTRSEVIVQFPSTENARVAVSVRMVRDLSSKESIHDFEQYKQIDRLFFPKNVNSEAMLFFAEWKPEKCCVAKQEVDLLPEVRGGLISGKIIPARRNEIVSFNTIGEKYQLQTTTISDDGTFLLQVEESQQEQSSFIGLIQPDSVKEIVIDSPFMSEYPEFDYIVPLLDSVEILEIVNKSRYNQLENAYFNVKQDTSYNTTDNDPIFTEFDWFYVLDDYNRFPQLHEHFIEYIPTVIARKTKNRSKMKVVLKEFMTDEYPPLLLLDGLPVTAEQILNFSPYKVKSIGVINHRIYLDDLVADGLVVFETFEHDLMGFQPDQHQRSFTYQGLEIKKNYQFPIYQDGNNLTRIPDYREQLFWNPKMKLEQGADNTVTFYTGDLTGVFEIIAEGYTESGEPVSYKGRFTVR